MNNISFKIPVGVLSVIVTIVILISTLIPVPVKDKSITLFEGSDKVIHFIMFFVLALVVITDYARYIYPRHIKIEKYVAIIVACCFIGGTIEVLQYSMGVGRHMEILDFICDAVGTTIGFLFYRYYFIRNYRNILKKKVSTRK